MLDSVTLLGYVLGMLHTCGRREAVPALGMEQPSPPRVDPWNCRPHAADYIDQGFDQGLERQHGRTRE